MNTTSVRTAAVADAAAPFPHNPEVSATRVVARAWGGHALVMVIAAVLTATTLLFGAAPAPAQAVSYRDIKSVAYGTCVYAYSDPVEGIYLKKCTTKPAAYGNWTFDLIGFYNRHQLWTLKRQNGSCLGIDGAASYQYLFSSCAPSGNVWEIFPVGDTRYVFKSFSAFLKWHVHTCLTFNGRQGGPRPQLGACSLTSNADQIYR